MPSSVLPHDIWLTTRTSSAAMELNNYYYDSLKFTKYYWSSSLYFGFIGINDIMPAFAVRVNWAGTDAWKQQN